MVYKYGFECDIEYQWLCITRTFLKLEYVTSLRLVLLDVIILIIDINDLIALDRFLDILHRLDLPESNLLILRAGCEVLYIMVGRHLKLMGREGEVLDGVHVPRQTQSVSEEIMERCLRTRGASVGPFSELPPQTCVAMDVLVKAAHCEEKMLGAEGRQLECLLQVFTE